MTTLVLGVYTTPCYKRDKKWAYFRHVRGMVEGYIPSAVIERSTSYQRWQSMLKRIHTSMTLKDSGTCQGLAVPLSRSTETVLPSVFEGDRIPVQ